MAPRRNFDRAPLDSRSYREPLDGRVERYDGYDVRDDGYRRGYEPGTPATTEASTAPPDRPIWTKTSLQ